jgi:SAM-dependent methyltransferase
MTGCRLEVVVGCPGSGKSHFARTAFEGAPVLQFDALHNYTTGVTDYEAMGALLSQCSGTVVLDAYGFYLDPEMETLHGAVGRYLSEVNFHHVYVSPLESYVANIRRGTPWCRNPAHCMKVASADLRKFEGWLSRLTELGRAASVRYFHREDDRCEEMEDNTHLLAYADQPDPKVALLSRIDRLSGDGDYQAVELEGEIIRPGYSESERTWNTLQGLTSWKGRRVADLGCFNGYFSLQALKAGAHVTGYDADERAVRLAAFVLGVNGYRVGSSSEEGPSVLHRTLGNGPLLTEPWDIVLALNMLHHVRRDHGDEGVTRALREMFRCGEEVLIEADALEAQLAATVASETGHVGQSFPSHREGRSIWRWRRP